MLQREGKVELMAFPHEQPTRKIKGRARPSLLRASDAHWTADSTFLISDAVGSDKYTQITRIVSKRKKSEMDARHLDSAYKSKCDCFFTSDKKDIVNNREVLEALLGIEIYHHVDDLEKFLKKYFPEKL